MSPLALGWIAAAISLLLAAALWWRQRGLAAESREMAAQRDQLEGQLAASEKRFEDRAKAQRKRGEEIAELKKKLEKARKRAAAAHDSRSSDSSRLGQLEASLASAEAERLKAQRQVDGLRADLERREAPPRPVAAPPPPVAAPAAPAADPMDHPAAQALAKRAEKADARIRELEAEVASARKEGERHKRRVAALDTAYLAQHGELEAKKDRLKTQQEELERLRALRVTLGATEPQDPVPQVSEEG